MKSKHSTDHLMCENCRSRGASLFRFCQTSELEEITEAKSCQIFKRGQELFGEGSLPLGLFCINTGSIKIVKYASGDKEQIMRIAGPGEQVGYRSLITHRRYDVSAVAAEDSRVCIVPKEVFYKLTQSNKDFYAALVEQLCTVIETTQEKMADIAYKPVRGRIAEAILLLSRRSKEEGVINLTREDLASFVGTVKETAIRTLSEFRNERLISIEGRSIRVVNFSGLEKISGLYD